MSLQTAARRNPLDTPMIRQYLELKTAVPECILFFRMGDFYEMFLEDAQTAAPLLGLQLTSRNKGDPDEVPLCGFPYHQLDDYLAKLVLVGRKVAIGEQVEIIENGKKGFKREISRIVTPGLVTQGEEGLGLEAEKPRYLAAVFIGQRIGFSYLDISTGEFRVCEFAENPERAAQTLGDELARLGASEVLLEDTLKDSVWATQLRQLNIPVTFRSSAVFQANEPALRLSRALGVQSLSGFGLSEFTAGLNAAHAIFDYVLETQKSGADHIKALLPYRLEEAVHMDAATRRNLEIVRNTRDNSRRDTLLFSLDQTLTRQGSRLLEQWLTAPLLKREAIQARLSAVDEFVARLLEGSEQGDLIEKLVALLKQVSDLERICGRLALGTASPRDCLALGQSLSVIPQLLEALSPFKSALVKDCKAAFADPALAEMAQRILKTIAETAGLSTKDGGFICDGFSSDLDELRRLMRDTKGFIAEIEREERAKTGIHSLKVRYNRVFGYYLEVSKSNLKQVPDYFIRKQTLVNAERYIVPALKEFEEKLLHAQENAQNLELQAFQDLRAALTHRIAAISAASQAIARLDVFLCFARVAVQWNYVKPELTDEPVFSIQEGRHPVLERLTRDERFVPNDLEMDAAKRQILLITGPNMAGKSTIMRQLALTVLMAQCGSFVPAKSALLGVVDGIFTRVGASDHLALGQSTFMVEMSETANILHNATPQSLVILDEIGRGTSTYDGMSIAWALAEHLHNAVGARTLFATHYHELAELPKTLPRVVNCNIAVKEWSDRIVFLRKLLDGATNRSYGIQVARLAGVPETVLHRAREILSQLQAANLQQQKPPLQFDLFSAKEADDTQLKSDILEELQALNLNLLSPLEALNALSGMQKKLQIKK